MNRQKVTQQTIYYAHPKSLYNTPQEARDIALLEGLGFKVINPNTPEHDSASDNDMRYFEELVALQDALAFRSFITSEISAGVAKEIAVAKKLSMAVIELPTLVERRTLSVDETRLVLSELGQR